MSSEALHFRDKLPWMTDFRIRSTKCGGFWGVKSKFYFPFENMSTLKGRYFSLRLICSSLLLLYTINLVSSLIHISLPITRQSRIQICLPRHNFLTKTSYSSCSEDKHMVYNLKGKNKKTDSWRYFIIILLISTVLQEVITSLFNVLCSFNSPGSQYKAILIDSVSHSIRQIPFSNPVPKEYIKMYQTN